MGNPKNKNEPKKQKASKKSICKSSSAQKENMPKNEKTRTSMKPSPSDGIAMSKQLLLKKNIARTQRRSSTKPQRICPNGKPIPSLAELEKMFEDSDDDDPTPKTPTQTATCTTSTPVKQTSSNMNEKLQLSPTTIDKITERLLGSIQKQDLPDPSELLEATSLLREKTPPPPSVIPPKKRKKPDVPYIVGCKDRPKVMSKPSTNFCKGDDDYGVDGLDEDPEDQIPTKRAKKSRIPNYSKSIFNAHSDEIAERLINDDAGDLSDASSDSNKTIEYDPTLIRNPRPHSFSPTPSTSTNSIVIRQNDDLFNQSLKEINSHKASVMKKNIDEQIIQKSSPKEKEHNVQITNETTPKKKGDLPTTLRPPLKNEDDVIIEVINNPYDTIVIDCEITAGIQDTKNTVDANVIEIVEPSTEVIRPKKEVITNEIPNDDDCMIVASSIKNPQNLNEPIIIDDEYSSINTEFDSLHNETFEIIDVDDIIAENKSILDKWKTSGVELNKINTVVDVPTKYKVVAEVHVDIPSLSQATQNMQTPNTQQPAVMPNTTLQNNIPSLSQATQNMQMPNTQQPAVMPNTTLQNNIPSLSQATQNMQTLNTQQPAVMPNTTLQNNIPSLSQATQNMQTPNTEQPAVMPNTTLQSNKPPNPDKSRHMGSNSSVTLIQSNKRQGTTVSECPGYGFQRILDDFFKNIEQHSKTFTIPSNRETTRALNELCRFGKAIQFDNCISTPTPPVNTATHTSAKTFQNRADKRHAKRDALINFLRNEEFSTIAQPSPTPTRNIGDCPICLDPLSSSNGIASTICGHIFCLKCIQASVKTNGKKCPTCRKALKGVGGGYHQIFL